ncbi:MAG: TCR/Tet family MFS transporter [candidate division KSB1 bacterium]|nr:TCR/Tet family MFS transporter [candidate division KSB1 bacterium]MDZ7365800.1 TCR/Tet family MFS transporter [candidate division KSB1 bacterium]MDZ7403721.1 TCR/Tet family MFS transporter [candidate division KSB1 bacterium]
MTEPNPHTTPRRAALVFIFITVLLDILALGIIIPVLPKLVENFLGGNTARAAEMYGLFGTVWALMQFVFSPVLGALADRFGRRPVILISCFGLGFDYILMALAPTLSWLFVGRVISGITAASIPTAGAYITDVTPPEKRAAGFGMLGAAFGVGFVLGPALGGVLGGLNPRLPFWVASGLSLLNAMYGLFVLPESHPPERRAGFSWARANPVGSLRLLRSHPELFGLAAVNFLYYLAHEVLPSTFVLYAGYRYLWDESTVGLTLAVVGVCTGVVQAGLIKPVVARFGERRALIAGLLFGTAAFAIYGLAATGAVFMIGVPVMALWGLSGPSAQGLMTRRVEPAAQGQLQGALQSLRGITGMIGPGLFTLTFATFIGSRSDWHLPGAPFLLAALLVASAMTVAWRVTRVN